MNYIYFLTAILFQLVASLAQAQQPATQALPASEKTVAPQTPVGSASNATKLVTLKQLTTARKAINRLSIPLQVCRQQLTSEQIQNQVKLGKLDAMDLLSAGNFDQPSNNRWTTLIGQLRKKLDKQPAR